jgi:hypothetical protein
MNYNKNIEAIKKNNEKLAAWIDSQVETDWANLIEHKGKYNLSIKQNGTIQTAYKLNNPAKDAIDITKKLPFPKDCSTVVIGIGIGHLLYQILKRKEKDHKVIIIEPIGHLIKLAFQVYDFSKWIKNQTLFICTLKEDVVFCINYLDSMFVIQDWFVIAEKYITDRIEYAQISVYATEVINQLRCNTGTIMGAGYEMASNDIKNLPYIIRERGIEELRDKYKDMPAILVSTGPSLQKNVHLLKDKQDKVVIIAVAQALRILLAYDITPDFICTVDFGDINYGHFKGLMDSKVPLIALNRTYAEILKDWKGIKYICASPQPGFQDTCTTILKDKGAVDQGGSVAHLCFGAAVHLGCNPIAFIGQDLALSDDKSHIELVDHGGDVKIENGQIKWKVKDPCIECRDILAIMC